MKIVVVATVVTGKMIVATVNLKTAATEIPAAGIMMTVEVLDGKVAISVKNTIGVAATPPGVTDVICQATSIQGIMAVIEITDIHRTMEVAKLPMEAEWVLAPEATMDRPVRVDYTIATTKTWVVADIQIAEAA
jgi:hypothetical protein